MALEGEMDRAGTLLAFIEAHPQTLRLYVELAEDWLSGLELGEPVEDPADPGTLERVAAPLLANSLAKSITVYQS